MLRRLLVPAVVLTVVTLVGLGLVYPLVMTGVARVVFPDRSDGSFVTHRGKVVGSSLIGQNFLDKKGDPAPRYFQPRPSASGASGYDPTGATCPPTNPSCIASGASNLGPGDPKLVGFIPGFNTVDLKGNASKTNPFATSDDPYCVPTDEQDNPITSPVGGEKYKKKDGTYACYAQTVPERLLSYRDLNGLSARTQVPADAVTASASGLDPDISVANARLQTARVAKARRLPVTTVRNLVKQHTDDPQWGTLGEKRINVLNLNLALDDMHR